MIHVINPLSLHRSFGGNYTSLEASHLYQSFTQLHEHLISMTLSLVLIKVFNGTAIVDISER